MTSSKDIFISYRRSDGAQYARLLQLELQKHGYSVFLDYEELSGGIFERGIQEGIKSAPVFIAILSPGYLSRFGDEKDWVRNELELAIQLNKYLIFINPDNRFTGIPEGIPSEIASTLSGIQHSVISFGQDFEAAVDILEKNRISSIIGRPKRSKKWFGRLIEQVHGGDKRENLIDSYIPKQTEFDIFISYRRIDGRDHARNIQLALKGHGYKHIFFDYDSIQKGEFNKRIIDAIYSCSDFILVLSPLSMKRCPERGDPVANEIRTAIKYQKNIIPVTIDGKDVKWPRSFPSDLQIIRGLQFHDLKSDSYFDHSIDELCEKLAAKLATEKK